MTVVGGVAAFIWVLITTEDRMLKKSRRSRQIVRAHRSHRSSFLETLETRQLFAAAPTPATFASLQAAIDSALPGSTITVAAGTVQELVTVNKPLIIRGAQAGVDARDSSRGQSETIIRGGAVTDGTRSSSFLITASGVTIDGFTVQDDSSSNLYGAGIVIAPGVSGTRIVNNVVQSNVAGLYLANSNNAQPCVIQHNLFKDNNNAGVNSGRGIYTDGGISGGNLTRVVIDANTFTGNVGFGPPDNPQAAIGFETQTAGKQSNITITNNLMQGNGKGVLLYNVNNVMIDGNVMSASTDVNSAAIRIEGGASNVTIKHNTVTGNLGAAMRVTTIFTGPSTNIIATANNFYGNTAGGLTVDAGGYSGTLIATNNWWGSSTGPGGNGPGFGDALIAPDANVDFTPWATAPISSKPTDAATPRGLRQIVIQDLAAVRDELTGRMRHFANDAITNLKASLADAYWIDDSHLAPGAGKALFELDRKATKQLRKSVKGEPRETLPEGLAETVHRIANLERMMAMIAIADAAGGDAKDLIHANRELSAGVNDLARGSYDTAITHFMTSWELSIHAEKKANDAKPAKAQQEESKKHKKKEDKSDDDLEGDDQSDD